MEKTVEYMMDRIFHYEDLWFINNQKPVMPTMPPTMVPPADMTTAATTAAPAHQEQAPQSDVDVVQEKALDTVHSVINALKWIIA